MKISFLQKPSFPQLIPSDTCKAVPTDSFQILNRKLECFLLKSEKSIKLFINLSSKISCGEIEFGFHNHADVLRRNTKSFRSMSEFRKITQIAFTKKDCFLQMAPLGKYNAVPTDSSHFSSQKLGSFALKILKIPNKCFFPQNVPLQKEKAVLTNVAFFSCRKSLNFEISIRKQRKSFFQTFSPIVPLGTYHAIPLELPLILSQMSEKFQPKIWEKTENPFCYCPNECPVES